MSIQTEKDIISQDWEILENGKIIQLNYQKWTDPSFESWNQNCDCVTWTYDPDSSCIDGYRIKENPITSVNRLGNLQTFEDFTKYKKRSRGNVKDCPLVTNYFPCNVDCKVSDWKQPKEPENCYLEQDGYKYKRPIRQVISKEQGSGVPCPTLSQLVGEKIRCTGGPYNVSPYTDPCTTPLFVVNNPELCQVLVGGTIDCNKSEALLVNYRDTYCKNQFIEKCTNNTVFRSLYGNTCNNAVGYELPTVSLQELSQTAYIDKGLALSELTSVGTVGTYIRTNRKLSFQDMFIRDNRGSYKNIY
jgi:hypothetical protein